ncbi:MAG TPA: hypothetical protein VGL38_06920 [bacterium]
MTHRESNIEFDFGSAHVQQIQNDELGHGLKNVDFIIREADRTILLEVKGTGGKAADFLSNAKILEFVEKARDTYTYLHLTQDLAQPLTFVALVDFTGGARLESPFMNRRHDSLNANLRQEKGNRWKIQYIQHSLLMSLDGFVIHFPDYTAKRQAVGV